MGYITEITADGDEDSVAYQPASSLENFRVHDVIHKMHHRGGQQFTMPDDRAKDMLNDAVKRIWDVTEKELGDMTMRDVVLDAGALHKAKAPTFKDEVEALIQSEEQIQQQRGADGAGAEGKG